MLIIKRKVFAWIVSFNAADYLLSIEFNAKKKKKIIQFSIIKKIVCSLPGPNERQQTYWKGKKNNKIIECGLLYIYTRTHIRQIGLFYLVCVICVLVQVDWTRKIKGTQTKTTESVERKVNGKGDLLIWTQFLYVIMLQIFRDGVFH